MRWFRQRKRLDPKNVPEALRPFLDLVDRFGPTDYEGDDSRRIHEKLMRERAELDEIERRLADWTQTEEDVLRQWQEDAPDSEECTRFDQFFLLMDGLDIRQNLPTKGPIEEAMERLNLVHGNKASDSNGRCLAGASLRHYGRFAEAALPLLHASVEDQEFMAVASCRVAIAQISLELGRQSEFDDQLAQLRRLRAAAVKAASDGDAILDAKIACLDADVELLTGDPVKRDGFALGVAVRDNHLPRVKELLARCSIETPDQDGRTPLQNAVMANAHDVLEHLLENGASPNPDSTWNAASTPLHMAVEDRNNHRILELLCRYGADLSTKDDEGLTPAMLAAELGHREYLAILQPKDPK